jgi:predicted extracellular nuclease
VVGLIEIENNDGALEDLVAGLNQATEPGRYAAVETGIIGTDVIKVAFAYQPARVTPLGDHAILDSSVDPRFNDDLNRPALAQTFRDHETGGVFTAVVNHLKSKGSDCIAVGDPDTGDGAGNCNLTRLAAAEALVDWLDSDPTGSGDHDFLIIGDLNSYDKEDPIDELLAGGYTDLVHEYQGEFAYSYVFDGMLGYLDHALAGEGLVDEVTGATVWHINADEPSILDYDMSFKQPAQDALYEPDAYRSSDHDPVIVGLDVCDEIAPEIAVSVTPDRLWPPNHKYVTVKATVTASDDVDATPAVRLESATSSEPDDAPGGADGTTTNDVVVVDDRTIRLRAERNEDGEGRVYTITFEATDDCGNSTQGSATVQVPVSR